MKRLLDYFRGFSKSERFRTISVHSKANQRYQSEVRKYIAIQQNQTFDAPKPVGTFSLKFLEKFQ